MTRPVRHVLLGVVALAVTSVACVPSSGDPGTRSASELGLKVARKVVPTTVAPAPPADAITPVTTSPPPSQPAAPSPVMPPSGSYITTGSRLGVGGCPLFPADHVFHATVSDLPRHPSSERMLAAAGAGLPLKAFFGSAVFQGSRLGIPVNVVDGRTVPRRDLLVAHEYQYSSEPFGVPWPNEIRFEGWPGRAWDKHLLVVDSQTCRSWEAINVQAPYENLFGSLLDMWYADSVVTIDLDSNLPRPNGTVTASGFSMLAGQVRYDEVAAGSIDHVLGAVMPVIRSGPPVWPAMRSDGRSADAFAPPMGTWLRLKSTTDLSGLGPQASVVARALRKHGAIISDTSANFALSGEPHLGWNDADLASLNGLTLDDFEVVDPTAMKVSDSSFQIR